MKKIRRVLILSFFFTLGQISEAQVLSLPDGFSTGDNVWYLRTGVSLNNVSGSGVDNVRAQWAADRCYGDFKNTLGATAIFGLICPFAPSHFYYGINISLGMRGFKSSAQWSEDISDLINQTEQLTAFNAQISPTNIGYIIKLSNNTAFDFHVGMFFSCDFAGSLKYTEKNSQKKEDSNSVKMKDVENYNKYDIGVHGGIGLWCNHWGIELIYQRGLASIYKGDHNIFSNQIQLSLGYAF